MSAEEAVLTFEDAAQWESWLAEHHDGGTGVWLKIAKKGSGATSVTQPQALATCLCYGWIDSHRRSFDEKSYLQRYSRRRTGSPWSQVNVEQAEALIDEGRMRPPGFAEIASAQVDGRWSAAYPSQRNATAPPDLVAALEEHPRAKAAYDCLGRTGRYAVILRLAKTRTPRSRATSLATVIAGLEA
ncbi:YdeI/OmpD-associated family protein [Streptosporangium sp. CA-135522]|uniref:YdeI/OmpD-associated family protein n=1 Tax=Streptosporangium sp. CA-135522 TaxID=3240072 RepID=UPI003D92F5B2